jgi:uncharacterized membrane protein
MTDPISRTTHDDAPITAAKRPAKSAAAQAGIDAPAHFELIGRTVTINRPREELYAFWRNFANLARFMENIHSVTVLDDSRSHWVVSAPAGKSVEWDSLIEEDVPNERISWRSIENTGIRHGGRVEFRPAHGGRGTEVSAVIAYDPPAGALGKVVAKLFQKEPRIQARRDLRRFKQLMEAGEIATAQPPDAAPRA